MKIFSNFDTNLEDKLCEEYGQIFGSDKVVVLHKTKRYLYRHVWFPYVMFLIFALIVTNVVYGWLFLPDSFVLPVIVERLLWAMVAVYFVYTVTHTFKYYVNYKMDFLVVTPKEVIKYDQEGVWQRKAEKLSTRHIKSVTVSKDGFLASFLDIWSIYFLAEGEDVRGMLAIEYVDAVEWKEKIIRHILWMDTIA